MYIPIGIKSDYSLLQSLIKIPELIEYLKANSITACGLLDDNLFGSMNFYNSCLSNGIKPIIGLKVKINDYYIYLYAKNYDGYINLLKVNTLVQKNEINYVSLSTYSKDVICVIPYKCRDILIKIDDIYNEVFIGYVDDYEKSNASLLNRKIVYVCEIGAFLFKDVRYLSILRDIDNGE